MIAVWVFGGLLEDILEKRALVLWDADVHIWFHEHATSDGRRAFNLITKLGSQVVWALVALVALSLLFRKDRLLFLAWTGANLGGKIVQRTLKALIGRDRPEYATEYVELSSYSFPSGHSMTAAVCYFMLAFVLSTLFGWTGRRRAAAYGVAGAIVLMVAFSRVYLGVHFPSDVAGGVAAGIAWVVMCITVVRIVRSRPKKATKGR